MNDGATMSFKRISCIFLPALLASLTGCATLTDSTEQEVAVRAILDHREVAGVGCILSNDAGRWFVTAPGRVTVHKSRGDLAISCSKDGVGSAAEVVASRFGTGQLIGNAVVSGGLGYLVDRRTGAGFDYPVTLTVLMCRPVDDRGIETASSANMLY
jgi:hypothetical protein